MPVCFSVAGKRRECIRCKEMVPKGTPMMIDQCKAWPGSRYWTKMATCYKCVMREFEIAAPNVWSLYSIEKEMETEGMLDAG